VVDDCGLDDDQARIRPSTVVTALTWMVRDFQAEEEWPEMDRAVERARRIGQRWQDDLDSLETATQTAAEDSSDSEWLLTYVRELMDQAQDFCAELFDPATAPRPEGKADERPLPAVVPAPPGTPGDGRLRRRRAAGGRCRSTPHGTAVPLVVGGRPQSPLCPRRASP